MTTLPHSIEYACDLRDATAASILAEDVSSVTGYSLAALKSSGDPTGFRSAQDELFSPASPGARRLSAIRERAGMSPGSAIRVLLVLGLSSPARCGDYATTRRRKLRTLTPPRGQAGYVHGAIGVHDTARVEVGCLWLLREIAAGRM